VLDLGSGPGFIVKHLDQEITQKVTMTDSSRAFNLLPSSSLS
jgi:NADH dehydrogenase [ubiquinone] 1 alpha subcomplex assembly factor 5